MNKFREFIRRTIRKCGYDLVPYRVRSMGVDAYQDIPQFLKKIESPMVFDVGANIGQTIGRVKNVLPNALMHCFEPSPGVFNELNQNCKNLGAKNVRTWNCGVGAQAGRLKLLENKKSVMTSFLEPGKLGVGEIATETEVDVITLDSFASQNNIDFVHLVKVDTQGFEFEVLKGALSLMQQNRIGLLYFEYIFSDQYKNVPPFTDVLKFLLDNNFSLVSFYQPHFQRHLLSWTDFVFINNRFYQSNCPEKKK